MKIHKRLYTFCIYTAIFACNMSYALATDIQEGVNSDKSPSIKIPLDAYLDNKAFGQGGNFDGLYNYFREPITDKYGKQLIDYSFKAADALQKPLDNIQITAQKLVSIDLFKDASGGTNTSLGMIYMLASASHGPATAHVSIVYSDGTEDTTTVSLPDWQDEFVDQLERYHPIRYSLSILGRLGSLFSVPIYVDSKKHPRTVKISPLETTDAAIHLFAIQAFPAAHSGIIITSVQSIQEVSERPKQLALIRFHNIGTTWVKDVRILGQTNNEATMISMPKVVPPGHSSLIYAEAGVITDSEEASVTLEYNNEEGSRFTTKEIRIGLRNKQDEYSQTIPSVRIHRSPAWLRKAKFGIFIHWGLYSVPAWAPVGKSYAEWYWWNYNQRASPTFEYHRQTYGEQFEYDQFLRLWKPDSFNPDTWLDLIDSSRARYFVFTAKHHDGIALFNTNVTNRSTVHLLDEPRDFVSELMQRSKTAYPHLKRGLYFSLPEWYHPSYSDQSLGWRGPPINPYTNAEVAYSGSKNISDFVDELQVPQLLELTETHEPDILWCDIGGIHNSSIWQAQYFNRAIMKNRQVAVNDRCGDGSASDFTTVEYKSISDMPTRFWEATRGMDPYSFGYNRETKPEEYASSAELIQMLVNTVAYGGNFLLNIGPDASGKVPNVMAERLQNIGGWLNKVETAIFSTVPYWITAKEDDDLRFTASEDGARIYIFYFDASNVSTRNGTTITVKTPLPELSRNSTTVRLLNDEKAQTEWFYTSTNGLGINYSSDDISEQPLVFEIRYV